MRYTKDKNLNELIKEKKKQGWTVTYGKHLKLRSPKGRLVSTSLSPSCTHAFNQAARDIAKIEKEEESRGNSGTTTNNNTDL